MAFQRVRAGESFRHDPHMKVSPPIARAGMTHMEAALIGDLEFLGGEGCFEARSDSGNSVDTHGSVCRTGLTSTLEKTPAVRYGSAAAQASAASRDSNSAMIRLPLKPAGPGSGLSIAGWGPAKTRRPLRSNACTHSRRRGRACTRLLELSSASRAMML